LSAWIPEGPLRAFHVFRMSCLVFIGLTMHNLRQTKHQVPEERHVLPHRQEVSQRGLIVDRKHFNLPSQAHGE